MSSRMILVCIALFGLAPPSFADSGTGATDPSAISQSAANRVPDKLSNSDWSSIRAAYEAKRHEAFPVDGGYQAWNPGQRWRTRFDGQGFDTTADGGGWSWGLELVGYGWDCAVRGVTLPVCVDAVGKRVEYRWDENLSEWYINDQRGLEHGYTVSKRQNAKTPKKQNSLLRFDLAVRGELKPRISGDGRVVSFVNDAGAAVVNYGGLKVFDATGEEIPAWFEGAAPQPPQIFSILIDDANAIYPLTIDPVAQQAYLKASNTDGGIPFGDDFGLSVSVSGNSVVVGAPYEDSSATGVNGDGADNSAAESGAAYVFVRSGGVWTQQAYLKASNTEANDYFGYSVSISGETIVVGAPGEDSSATGVNGDEADNSAADSGAAYVFVRNGGVWSQQSYLKASNTGDGDAFGNSVGVWEDTALVGAYYESSSATGVNGNQADNSAHASGAAYFFISRGGVWSQQAYVKASNTGAGDLFGRSVAVSGDIGVVGASGQAGNSGAAYVFVRNDGVWSQQAYLKASNPGEGDGFGYSVAVSGDTVVVGATWEDSSATGVNGTQGNNGSFNSGAAYVFLRTGAVWSQQAYLKSSNSGAGDQFGWSVAVSGDALVVGAFYEDSNATGVNGNQNNNSSTDSGAAYVFVRNGGAWSQQAYLKASNTETLDQFGVSVAISGDTVIVGAFSEDSSATGPNGNQADNSANESGAAYVFTGVGLDFDGDGMPDSIDTDDDNDGVLDASDICSRNTPGLPVDGSGRPLSDLNGDCRVDGLDIQAYVNDPSVRPIAEFVADLLL